MSDHHDTGDQDPDESELPTTERHEPLPSPTTPAGEAPAESEAERGPVESLARRTNLLIGILAVLLLGSFVVIGLLFGRVADAQRDAEAARAEVAAGGGDVTRAEFDDLRDELEQVEAGAALYASQLEGLQQQLADAGPEISAGVDEAITGLREFGESTIEFDVAIDEVIPIDTEVVIDRTVEVPINTELPINLDFETTVEVDTPIGTFPLDISVPVDETVPIDITVDVPINESIPVQDEFPVQLEVPIAIDVADTELAGLTESLATGLESLQELLTGLTG